MTAANSPRPTPSFTIQTGNPTEAVRSHVDPVIPAKSVDSLGIDAALPRDNGVRFSMSARPWSEVLTAWQSQIAAEQLADVQIRHYRTPTDTAPAGLHLRGTDGALVRKAGSAVAYTEHAWAQLISLLLQEVPGKPRGAAEPLRWLSPSVRALAFADVRNRSRRAEGEGNEIILRSFVDPRTGVRALRAVLSGRHSGIHFDDLAISRLLDREIVATAPAYVSRSVNATRGYAVIGEAGEARATLSWSNSETGCASLAFSGGVYIAALDALIVNGQKRTVDADLGVARLQTTHVTIAAASKGTRRAHTLPRKERTEAERADIAAERVRTDVDTATTEAQDLVDAWAKARETFAPGWSAADAGVQSSDTRAAMVDVVLDAVEEFTRGFSAEDRAAMQKLLTDSDRLFALPFMSAAMIAGAWAVMARECGDWDQADRMQNEAHRWITKGFSKK